VLARLLIDLCVCRIMSLNPPYIRDFRQRKSFPPYLMGHFTFTGKGICATMNAVGKCSLTSL